ncbi:MAG: SPASM domain-containing protein, partial [Kovacikia sp.]
FGHNEHEVETARNLAAELGMKFYVKLSWSEDFSPINNEALFLSQSGLNVTSRSEYEEKYGSGYLQKDICTQLWKIPQINWDGKILGCCYNYWGDFGNAFETGMKEGLNNDKITYARRMLLGLAEAREGIPCTTCNHYQRMHQKSDWLTPDVVKVSRKTQMMGKLGRLKVWAINRIPLAAAAYVKRAA